MVTAAPKASGGRILPAVRGTALLGAALALAAALSAVFSAAEWYGERVSVPRYCDDPEGHVTRVGRILSEPRPAEEDSRRPYVIAAKLLYLVPQQRDEAVADYLARLRHRIEAACR